LKWINIVNHTDMRKLPLLFLLTVMSLTACEVPDSPDFNTSQRVEAPILFDREFTFLGEGETAIIDTTKDSFDSLFTVESNGFVRLARQEEFEFGDLDDAIPTVDVSPTNFSTQVGEIEIGDFSSSQGNVGQAGFQALTGLDPSAIQPGDPVPPQTVTLEVTIDLDTDFFQSATFKGGSLDIQLENQLGFNLDNISITLISSPAGGPEVDVVTGNTGTIDHNNTSVITLTLNTGDELANPRARISISWTSSTNPADPGFQTFQESPDALIVNSVVGNNLVASQITAVLPVQDFSTTGNASFSDDEFRFESTDHFVELETGVLSITNIINQIDIGIESLDITFPGILSPADVPLSISLQVDANSTSPDINRDLSGFRVFAPGNQVAYEIQALTEDRQSGSGTLSTINENDQVNADIQIQNLELSRVRGVVVTRVIDVNNDDPANGEGVFDLFNDDEAEITVIDAFEELSNQLEGVEFAEPSISLAYTTNINIPTEVVGAFVGVDGNGNQTFLTADPGSSLEVLTPQPGLLSNGSQIPASQLLNISLTPNPDPVTGLTNGLIEFNIDETNINEFVNELPSEIRFISKAIVNPNEVTGEVGVPVQFTPSFTVDLPIAFSTPNGAFFSDSAEVDLGDFPGQDDEENLTEGLLTISYENELPLGVDLTLVFKDGNGNQLFSAPNLNVSEPLILEAAPVDAGGFSSGPASDALVFSLDESQLDILNQTRELDIQATLNTTANDVVRIRSQDKIKVSVSVSLTVETEVN